MTYECSITDYILAIFEQNKGIGLPASDVFRICESRGLDFSYITVCKTCHRLHEQGKVAKEIRYYGIPMDGKLYRIPRSKKLLVPQNLRAQIEQIMLAKCSFPHSSPKPIRHKDISLSFSPPPPPPPNGHCDRCGKRFKLGEPRYIRKFRNIDLYLCKDCNEQKKPEAGPIAPLLF